MCLKPLLFEIGGGVLNKYKSLSVYGLVKKQPQVLVFFLIERGSCFFFVFFCGGPSVFFVFFEGGGRAVACLFL